jgi:hypothetical protein
MRVGHRIPVCPGRLWQVLDHTQLIADIVAQADMAMSHTIVLLRRALNAMEDP